MQSDDDYEGHWTLTVKPSQAEKLHALRGELELSDNQQIVDVALSIMDALKSELNNGMAIIILDEDTGNYLILDNPAFTFLMKKSGAARLLPSQAPFLDGQAISTKDNVQLVSLVVDSPYRRRIDGYVRDFGCSNRGAFYSEALCVFMTLCEVRKEGLTIAAFDIALDEYYPLSIPILDCLMPLRPEGKSRLEAQKVIELLRSGPQTK